MLNLPQQKNLMKLWKAINDNFKQSNISNNPSNENDNMEIIDFIEDNTTDTFESYCKIKMEEVNLPFFCGF